MEGWVCGGTFRKKQVARPLVATLFHIKTGIHSLVMVKCVCGTCRVASAAAHDLQQEGSHGAGRLNGWCVIARLGVIARQGTDVGVGTAAARRDVL